MARRRDDQFIAELRAGSAASSNFDIDRDQLRASGMSASIATA